MTDEEFEARVASMEARAKRILQSVVSLVAALGVTVLGMWAAWDQVHDRLAQVDAHVAVNDNRLDKDGAPPPDPDVAAAAIAAGE